MTTNKKPARVSRSRAGASGRLAKAPDQLEAKPSKAVKLVNSGRFKAKTAVPEQPATFDANTAKPGAYRRVMKFNAQRDAHLLPQRRSLDARMAEEAEEARATCNNLTHQQRAAGLKRAMEIINAAAKPAPKKRECKCTLRERALGDGCDVCNPELAAEIAAENKADGRAAPKKRKGRVVALVGTTAFRCAMPPIVKLDAPREALVDQAPVFVLPADAASVERMIKQMGKVIFPDGIGADQRARAALAAIGIRAAKKGGAK